MSLQDAAGEIARSIGDKGCAILTYTKAGGIRIGASNLSPEELREALTAAIYYSYAMAESLPSRRYDA